MQSKVEQRLEEEAVGHSDIDGKSVPAEGTASVNP